jgi:hypothetical protein
MDSSDARWADWAVAVIKIVLSGDGVRPLDRRFRHSTRKLLSHPDQILRPIGKHSMLFPLRLALPNELQMVWLFAVAFDSAV